MFEMIRKKYGIGKVVGDWRGETRIFFEKAIRDIKIIAVDMSRKRAIEWANKDNLIVVGYRGLTPIIGERYSVYIKFPI